MVGDRLRGSRSFFCIGTNVKARFSEPICFGFLRKVLEWRWCSKIMSGTEKPLEPAPVGHALPEDRPSQR